ncbi:MAG: cation/multidrug efflux pump, partial [Planctomycetaceae bacterium]|nr:cation/multidrug efflux pump [Planctomycetaceae bacterium]
VYQGWCRKAGNGLKEIYASRRKGEAVISHFFIDRPIFAAVLSIVIVLTGGIAVFYLPIAQYPQITPPAVQVSISYPGANSQVVADTVAAPIEQQVNGVEGMLYMSSQMGNDGSYSLTVTFDIGTDLNTALVMVQNRVSLAMPQLPTSVQNQGITIRKKTPDILMVINFFSPDDRYDNIYLSNYATINIKDELLRTEGVSDIVVLGQRDYSIRAWLDPQKLASCNMTAMDVAAAIRSQNLDAPIGQVGQPTAPQGQSFQLPVETLGRLSEPEEFGEIIVKVGGGSSAPQMSASRSGASSPQSSNITNLLQSGIAGGMTTGSTTTDLTAMAGNSAGSVSQFTATADVQTGNKTTNSTTSGSNNSPTGSSTGGTTGGGTTGGAGTSTGAGTLTNNSGTSSSSSGGTGNSSGTASGLPTSATSTPNASSQTGTAVVSGTSQATRPASPAVGIVRLRDVATVEMGAQNYNQFCTFDGKPSAGLAIFQLPGTNALDIADRAKRKMAELKTRFPDGIDYTIAYDTTPFVRESVNDVVRTLLEAIVLVGLVVLVFLQNWRAVLIPLIAVPVAIIGTFAVMAVCNFSLNNISLFGLVLAIGIVVDDAIVVVENVERWLDQGLSSRDATRKAMEEVTGPVVAVALVLCAVFVPCAFISGITGRFFLQFAVTISVSTVFSAINSLTLSPALAAILLRPHDSQRDWLTRLLDFTLGWFFRLFNWAFEASTSAYGWVVGKLLHLSLIVLLIYVGLLVLTYWVFQIAPTGFVPDQDQGRVIANVQLPDSSSLERTREIVEKIDKIARDTPGVSHTVTISGMSFVLSATSSNFASMFIVLDPFEERKSPELHDSKIMDQLRREWGKQIKDAQVMVFGAPPIPGLSVAGGFKLLVEDRGGLGLEALQRETDSLIAKLQKQPDLTGVSTQFRSNTPQLFMDIDRAKMEALGVSVNDVNQTLSMYMGSLYVNSFNAFGRHWQVTIQADGAYRSRTEGLNLLKVRSRAGQMISLGTLINLREIGGPVFVTRYNLSSAAPITGNLRPGVSTGEAISATEKLAAESLPLSMKTEWTELMFMQIRAGNTAIYVFLLAILCVFLALSALYESWSLPLAVILVVPLCLLCSVGGVLWTGSSVNIFVQIGLVVLVGLACKNAILIVEFAKQLHQDGKARFEATQEASQRRLRPILMTSFAFILGVVPLVIAKGAGAEMRQSLGTAVFSGMIGVTLFGIFLTPVFFYVILGLGESKFFSSPLVRRTGLSVMIVLGIGAVSIATFGIPAWGIPAVGIPKSVQLAVLIIVVLGIPAVMLIRSLRRHEPTPPPSATNPGPKGDQT